MNQAASISVVIPTYNRLWALPRSVAQFYDNPLVGEIIVVNDASPDASREWLDRESIEHPILRPIHHRDNRGATGARNTGIEAARCEFIFFWDDDMLLAPADGLQILFSELLRYGGDMIAPAIAASEDEAMPELPRPADTAGELLVSDVLLNRWTLMMRGVPRDAIPKQTFQSALLYGWTLQRRDLYQHVRYSDDFAPTYFRDETDVQLALLERGCRLLFCPFTCALDMQRPVLLNDGGCHSQGTLWKYDWGACRNNWRMLRRRRHAIRSKLGIRTPLFLLQAIFVCDRLLYRLPRKLAGQFLRTLGLRK